MALYKYCIMSLKVTGTDMDRSATYDFLLVIPSNHETTISIENRNFSDHIYLRPPATRFSVKFGNGSGSKKN